MKNRKGFTLIEVIGVIIIIGVIALIAIPSFMSSLGVFRDDYYDNVVNTLENSGKEFFTDNKIYRPSKIFEARYVNLSTLEIENYIDNIEDYEGNSCNNDSYVVVVRRGKNDYEYAVCLKCEADDYSTTNNKYCDPAWLDSTKIGYGLGEIPTLYVYKGTRREELKEQLKISAWIIKYDNDGNEIDRVDGSGLEEVPEIYPVNLDTIDTSKAGEYKTTYVFNEKLGEGKVVVYENSAPSITIKKENIVKSGTALENKSETKVSNYISGEWAQKITITMRAEDVNYNNSKTNVTKFQWKIDDRWLDFCDATDG
ncbi:MAG: prepilin-type N-terminal cleavage/methylation domain-containing protein, partial [Bacilli bacterium]|nr:prepilin-type N-terminal cleavage/methylation domain-containing protein [Bacilli bacterium]